MQVDHSSKGEEEPPAGHRLQTLKTFHSAGRGFWQDVSAADWNDWRWQMKHRITTRRAIAAFLPTLTPEEFAGAKLANHQARARHHAVFFQPD